MTSTTERNSELRVEGVTKQFATRGGELRVLRGVSLTQAAGASCAILGPSGSGKSTLLSILGGLDRPTAGRVMLDGADPAQLDDARLAQFRNQRVGFIFQDHHLLPQCNVLENVLIPTLARPEADPDAEARARSLLERVGLAQRLDHLPSELSGGERQRVAVARALINRPLLLLADEPTGNLDRAATDAVAALLLELHRQERTILVVVTHNVALAQRFDRRYEMTDGLLAVAA